MSNKDQGRREFLKKLGIGAGAGIALSALSPVTAFAKSNRPESYSRVGDDAGTNMTYRIQHKSGEKISLLGFGMMRLPVDQKKVDELVDYAMAHGVNYYDTAPIYLAGKSEALTGNALSRYPREKYYVATKMSNFYPEAQTFDGAKKMYENSFKELKVDYIDYYLLHSIGGGGVANLRKRFIDNGVLDFLLEERKAGRIRHLGFSYHGDVEAFDWLVDRNSQYNWDFVQIQMNYLDWRHAQMSKKKSKDADAEYLYNKLEKFNIQAVIMEPLRGGGLMNIPQEYKEKMNELRPGASMAEWAFRWCGSFPNILTTLSGMNKMEHLAENVKTFSPVEVCTKEEKELLEVVADALSGIPTIPCTACAYCMPCPYGVNIPGNFTFYNDAVHSGLVKSDNFTQEYFKAIDAESRATQCVDCEECLPKCPQQIRIPNQMARIVELLKK